MQKSFVSSFNPLTYSTLTGITVLSLVTLLSAFSFTAHARQAPGTDSNIIGGTTVTDTSRWPWYVQLVEADQPDALQGSHCGGSLIAPNRVLTAAHCVDFKTAPSDYDVVVIGGHQLSDPGNSQRVGVTGISLHPDYSEMSGAVVHQRYDIAILKLAQSIQTPPVRLATPEQEAEHAEQWFDQQAVALGHGFTSFDHWEEISDSLQEGGLHILSPEACESAFSTPDLSSALDPISMICAQDTEPPIETSICYGDSGGPLVLGNGPNPEDYVQVGVASWTHGCDSGYPSGFARITAAHSFLTTPDQDLVFKPFNTVKPRLRGDPTTVGQTLTCCPGTWGGSPANFEYQWIVPGEGVRGRSKTYTVTPADIDKELVCTVTARNQGGTSKAFTNDW